MMKPASTPVNRSVSLIQVALWIMLAQPFSCSWWDRPEHPRQKVYTVEVLTADIRGADTNASVQIYLEDTMGHRTPPILLNNFFRTDFQRGQLDTFQLRECDTEGLKGRLSLLILERDDSGFANDWYVDHVTVSVTRGRETSEYVFPFNRWVLAMTKYRVPHLDTSLPADDPFPDQRQALLQHARRVYQITEDPTQPAFIVSLPVDEEWSDEYLAFTQGTAISALTANAQSTCPAGPWTSLSQLECLYTGDSAPYPRPLSVDRWQEDEWFGSQRLAGVDPTIIRLATEIPANLSVSETDLLPFLEGNYLNDVIGQKRLFVCDLGYLQSFRAGAYGRIVPSPIALFYANDNKMLMPIAIQLFQQPGADNPVFFPSDNNYTWTLAKMWYNLAESNNHQAASHLYLTHLAMESFSLATHRELSVSHPVFRILKPHFLFMLQINSRARQTFFGPTGIFSTLLNIGGDNVLKLGSKRLFAWRVDVEGTLPRALEERGLLNTDWLPYFPYRDDGLMVYDAVERYVSDYVSLYYKDDATLLSDAEIQTWAEKLAAPRQERGYGIQGLPLTSGKLTSRADLALVLTCVIFTSTAQHAAVNFPQYDQFTNIPGYPAYLTGEPPKDKTASGESDILQILPSRAVTLGSMQTTTYLSQMGLRPLGTPTGSFIVDSPAVKLGERFQKTLANIEQTIRAANAARDPPYDYLYPSNIPNSIGI